MSSSEDGSVSQNLQPQSSSFLHFSLHLAVSVAHRKDIRSRTKKRYDDIEQDDGGICGKHFTVFSKDTQAPFSCPP